MNSDMATSFKLSKFLKIILGTDLLPVALLFSYLILVFILKGVMPSGEEIINTFSNLYQKYGYEIIFFSALLEALIVVNLLVPGQIGMALGVVFARTGQTQLPLVIFFVVLGSVLGYLINYTLGYFGFSDILKKIGLGSYITETQKQLDKFGKRGLILSFIHVTIGSLSSFAAGTVKFNFPIFFLIALFSSIIWMTLWGLLIYALGEVFIEVFKKYSFFIFVLFIGVLLLGRFWKGFELKRKG